VQNTAKDPREGSVPPRTPTHRGRGPSGSPLEHEVELVGMSADGQSPVDGEEESDDEEVGARIGPHGRRRSVVYSDAEAKRDEYRQRLVEMQREMEEERRRRKDFKEHPAYKERSMFIFPANRRNNIRYYAGMIVVNPIFENFILVCIAVSCVLLALDEPHGSAVRGVVWCGVVGGMKQNRIERCGLCESSGLLVCSLCVSSSPGT
jgi:hypothetical protein